LKSGAEAQVLAEHEKQKRAVLLATWNDLQAN